MQKAIVRSSRAASLCRGTPLSRLDRGHRLASACRHTLGDVHLLTDACRRQRRSKLPFADCRRGIGGAEPRRQGVWGNIPPCGNSWRKTSPSLATKGGRGRRLAPHEPYHHLRQTPSTPLPTKPRQRSGATGRSGTLPPAAGGCRGDDVSRPCKKSPQNTSIEVQKKRPADRRPLGCADQSSTRSFLAMRSTLARASSTESARARRTPRRRCPRSSFLPKMRILVSGSARTSCRLSKAT